MKNIIFFFTLILSFVVTNVNAQNVSRGAKANQETVSTKENSKGISVEENVFASEVSPVRKNIRRVTLVSNTPNNTIVEKKTTELQKTELKQVTTPNSRQCQSQPINIRKTVNVQF